MKARRPRTDRFPINRASSLASSYGVSQANEHPGHKARVFAEAVEERDHYVVEVPVDYEFQADRPVWVPAFGRDNDGFMMPTAAVVAPVGWAPLKRR